ncbi:hypothetical protein [Streptomyces uncialis]|uniref:hypothetical protein n=1 Tax=Streptomyces uncialis TaxID=1048205 RepID=UPI00386F71F0|nr:hypothetical protein OG268_30775 [Streptomyces uncialis]
MTPPGKVAVAAGTGSAAAGAVTPRGPLVPAPRPPCPGGSAAGARPPGAGAVPEEPKGCLFALSQPPLMIFLAVIGGLLMMGAVHDLFLLGR